MFTSDKVDQIIPAVMKVKAKLQAVTKSAANPFFKSKYADLNTHLDAVEPLLAEYGLILLQPVKYSAANGQNTVASIIMHSSGQFISSEMGVLVEKTDMQKLGSAVTYARRYTLGSLLSMKAEDDDGESAVGRTAKDLARKEAAPTVPLGAIESGYNVAKEVANKTAEPVAQTARRASFRKSPAVTSNGDDI